MANPSAPSSTRFSAKENTGSQTQKRPASSMKNSQTTRIHVRGQLLLQNSQDQGAENSGTATLLTKIAEQQGKSFLVPFSCFYTRLAVIDQLTRNKTTESTNSLEEIPRPPKIRNLQHDMSLADDKKLYLHCQVSPFFLAFNPYLLQSIVQDVAIRVGLPLDHWRNQSLSDLSRVAQVVSNVTFHIFYLLL